MATEPRYAEVLARIEAARLDDDAPTDEDDLRYRMRIARRRSRRPMACRSGTGRCRDGALMWGGRRRSASAAARGERGRRAAVRRHPDGAGRPRCEKILDTRARAPGRRRRVQPGPASPTTASRSRCAVPGRRTASAWRLAVPAGRGRDARPAGRGRCSPRSASTTASATRTSAVLVTVAAVYLGTCARQRRGRLAAGGRVTGPARRAAACTSCGSACSRTSSGCRSTSSPTRRPAALMTRMTSDIDALTSCSRTAWCNLGRAGPHARRHHRRSCSS